MPDLRRLRVAFLWATINGPSAQLTRLKESTRRAATSIRFFIFRVALVIHNSIPSGYYNQVSDLIVLPGHITQLLGFFPTRIHTGSFCQLTVATSALPITFGGHNTFLKYTSCRGLGHY